MKSNENTLYILSAGDMEQLAKYLTKALQHFNHYRSTCEHSFLYHLHVVADCYRIILLHAGKNVLQDERIKIFTQYFESRTPDKIERISFAIAEMLSVVSDRIRLLSQPWFYSAYTAAVDHLLGDRMAYLHSNWQAGKRLRSKLIRHRGGIYR